MGRVKNTAEIHGDDLIPAADLKLLPAPLGYIETSIVYDQIDLPCFASMDRAAA